MRLIVTSLRQRYELEPSSACLAENRHLPLYAELVKDYSVEYIAGGAGQNSIRAAQVEGDVSPGLFPVLLS